MQPTGFGRQHKPQVSSMGLPLKIKLIKLGHFQSELLFHKIRKWKSDIFCIVDVEDLAQLPNAGGNEWVYDDEELESVILHDANCDVTVGIINKPLEDGYYVRRLGNNKCVITLDEMSVILEFYRLPLENFVIRNLYLLACVYYSSKNQIPKSPYGIAHDDTRGCLFDMNANKLDIRHSMHKPRLCDECRARLKSQQMPANFLSIMDRELRRLKKPTYELLADFVKTRPILSGIIGMMLALFIAFLGNYLYDHSGWRASTFESSAPVRESNQ